MCIYILRYLYLIYLSTYNFIYNFIITLKVACRVWISYILEIKKYVFVSIEIDEKREYVTSINFLFSHKMSFKPNKI